MKEKFKQKNKVGELPPTLLPTHRGIPLNGCAPALPLYLCPTPLPGNGINVNANIVNNKTNPKNILKNICFMSF